MPLRAVHMSEDGNIAEKQTGVMLPADASVTVLGRVDRPGMVEVECSGRRYAVFLYDLTTRAVLVD